MGHTDDAYAAMLLTMALSPNREEYARPFTTQEFRRFESAARASSYRSIGALLEMDISGLMMNLGLSEEESYRAFTLMHRGVQMSYALEGLAAQGIDVVTQYDADYPRRLEDKLKEAAPPFLYRCQSADIWGGPAIAIVGISGVRTTPEAQANIETLVLAKGFAQCVAVINGEACSVVVSNEGELQPAQISQINEIVYEQTGIKPTNIRIVTK